MEVTHKPATQVRHGREGFAIRLRKALHAAGYPHARLSEVTRQYNARSSQAVSLHAVRKWLSAETLPRQQHIASLAAWLNCNPNWLRDGSGETAATSNDDAKHEAVVMLTDVALLNSYEKTLVRELGNMLLKKSR